MAQESSMKCLLLCLLVRFADAGKRPSPCNEDHRPPSYAMAHPVSRPKTPSKTQVPVTPPPRAARAKAAKGKTSGPAPPGAPPRVPGQPRVPRNLAIGAASAEPGLPLPQYPTVVSRLDALQHQMDTVIAMQVQAARRQDLHSHMLTTMATYCGVPDMGSSASSSSSAAPATNAFGGAPSWLSCINHGSPATNAEILAMCQSSSSSTAPAVNASGGAPSLLSASSGSAAPPAIEEPRHSQPNETQLNLNAEAAAFPKIGKNKFCRSKQMTVETGVDDAHPVGEAIVDAHPVGEAIVDPPPVGEAIAGEATPDAAAYEETQPNETQLNFNGNAVIDVNDLEESCP